MLELFVDNNCAFLVISSSNSLLEISFAQILRFFFLLINNNHFHSYIDSNELEIEDNTESSIPASYFDI